MEVKINILDVKDGDAILIELIKPSDVLIMVIDGGEKAFYQKKVKPKLQEILKKHGKKAPDVVVCTHFDSDHIGGLIPLLEDYISGIKQVWVHSSTAALEILNWQLEDLKTGDLKNSKNSKHVILEKELLLESARSRREILKKTDFIIESLNQLKKFINLIPAKKLKQVFHKQNPLPAWPELSVLGPTKAYFDSLFPKKKELKALILEELHALENGTDSEQEPIGEMKDLNPCDKLKKDNTAKLTSVNKASIIVAIDNKNGRYLFTGDAGIESFKKIPDWQNELKNLFFLKVPHHGSNNNMSKEIAFTMNPSYALSSGDGHEDSEVISCLAQKTKDKEVKTTKANGDLYFDK